MNSQTHSKSKANTNLRQKALHLAVASCFAVMPTISLAADVNSVFTVTNGTAIGTVSGNGKNLNIDASNYAILKWPSFNILKGESVYANISKAGSVLFKVDPVLFKVAPSMSNILGTLGSNGKVFLINPAGIMVGAGATINTAGFIASSLNISDDDFMNGRMRFNADIANPGKVSNAGNITTPNGGFVYLIAPQVENIIDPTAAPGVKSGVITTPSGEAILAAGHSVELVDSADPAMRVKISAQSQDVNLSQMVTQSGGNIFSVLNSGKVSANTAVVGQNGKIQFRSAGKIDTTATSVVEAKGTSTLDGGYFRGFADTAGTYKGNFNVSGKNGGFIETSAAFLDIAGITSINASALSASGQGGTWLLDPYNLNIGATEAAVISSALNNDTSVMLDTSYASFSSANGFGGAYGDFSNAGGNGNILVTSAAHIHKTAGSASTLTFNADGTIDIFGTIDDTSGSPLSITMNSGLNRAGAVQGGVAFHTGSEVDIHGNFSIYNHNSGAVEFQNSPITANSISVNTYNSGSITGSGALQKLTANSVTLNSYGGNIGTSTDFLVLDTGYLNIGYSGGEAGAVYVKNNGDFDYADIWAGGDVNLRMASVNGGVAYGGDVTIHTPTSASVVSLLGDLELDDASISFYGDGEFVVEADNINMMNNSYISADGTGSGEVSLGVFAHNIMMSDSDIEVYSYNGDVSLGVFATESLVMQGSSPNSNPAYGLHAHSNYGDVSLVASAPTLIMDNATIHTVSSYGGTGLTVISNDLDMSHYSTIYGYAATSYGGSGDAVVDVFAFDHLNVDYSEITANSYYGSGVINILAGEVNVTNNYGSGASFISAQNELSIIAGGDINLTGGAYGGDSLLAAGDEMFLTMGDSLNLVSGGAYGGAAFIDVNSVSTLFMDFPTKTEGGIFIDGVAVDGSGTSFESTLNSNTGIFVDGAPGVVGENTFITYSKVTERDKDNILSGITKDLLAGTNFFEGDDDNKGQDDDGNDTGNGKSSKNKQCS